MSKSAADFQLAVIEGVRPVRWPSAEEDLHGYLFKLTLDTCVAVHEIIGRWPTANEQKTMATRMPEAWALGLRDDLDIMSYATDGLYSFNPASRAN